LDCLKPIRKSLISIGLDDLYGSISDAHGSNENSMSSQIVITVKL